MGRVLANDNRRWLRANARLLTDGLALVIVVVGGGAKRMAAGQGTRSILGRVLARELALHVARHGVGAVVLRVLWGG